MIRMRPGSFFDRIVVWSFNRPLRAPAQYLLAAVAIIGVGVARILFVPDTLPWFPFIPATIAIALILGKCPGLFAAILSATTGLVSLGSGPIDVSVAI
ncbi:hypothetical protein CA235_10865 [Sphingomonas sp. ABOLF]|uniref:hypothetical protein n=1 Tax=Sphingomonas sp. ABOLF TaxID=1985879 RepID=UPI000F7D9FAE|nr:hypothetical protein [Sphingomonas sp. ABOLF]RSV14996.1 hypothetical protein CA235_10865 [Sphingomonas sp. ABOLF]